MKGVDPVYISGDGRHLIIITFFHLYYKFILGLAGFVRELLNVLPHFAWKVDGNGYSPLHHSCNSGNLEITRMLLKLSADLALQFSNTGYMPLHLAAMNGNTLIFEEFEQMAPISVHHLTRQRYSFSFNCEMQALWGFHVVGGCLPQY